MTSSNSGSTALPASEGLVQKSDSDIVACACDLSKVSHPDSRPWHPIQKGHIGSTRVALLSAFLQYLPSSAPAGQFGSRLRTQAAPIPQGAEVRHSTNSDVAPTPQSSLTNGDAPSVTPSRIYSKHSGPRPCIIWDTAGRREKQASFNVLLMGTFSGTPADRLPEVLKDYFAAVYTPMTASSGAPNWDALWHIHTSPEWAEKSTQWLIPLPVTVLVDDLVPFRNSDMEEHLFADGRCAYINDDSLRELSRIKRLASARLRSMLSEGSSAQEAIQTFLRKVNQHARTTSTASMHASQASLAVPASRGATGGSVASSTHSTKTVVHAPRAPARVVQPGTSYSSITKLGTQKGSAMRTPSASSEPNRQASITSDTKLAHETPTTSSGKTGMKVKERSESPSSEASSSRTVRNKPLSSPKRMLATLTEKFRTARR